MNFNAINIAPITGHEAQFAAGAGALVVASTGQAKISRVAQGSAAIRVSSSASARYAALGRGNAIVVVGLSGNASQARISMGSASISLGASGLSANVALAAAQAMIEFGGRYGIPDVLPVPVTYQEAPGSRFVRADADDRIIRVPADQPLLVRPGGRRDSIQREGRQA